MKKLFLMFLLTGTSQLIAHAQVSLGARLGTNSSSYWKNDDGGNSPLTRMQAGLTAGFPITSSLTVQGEINYASKGDRWYFEEAEGDRENIRDVFHYLEIPVSVRYTFAGESIRPYALGGLYAARILSNKYTEDNVTYNFKNFPKTDFGVHLGGGVALPAGPGQAFIEARFSQGIKDLDIFKDGFTTRMKSFGISAGWVYLLN